MNRREKRRRAKIANKLVAPVAPPPQNVAPPPVARAEAPRTKRPFKARNLPLAGGIDVKITGKEAFGDDVVIKYEDDFVIVATGEAAAMIRANRNPLAALAVRTTPALPADVPAARQAPTLPRRGNASTFVSSSKIPTMPIEDPEPDETDNNVVPMQENGMPRAPRDRTAAQRRNLIVSDDKGNPALAIDMEKLANLK